MTNAARFWNRFAKRYDKSPVRDQATYNEKLIRTRAVLVPTAKVLEVGCGTGTTAISHAPYVAEITATDVAANMIDIARLKAAAAGAENVTFRTTGVEGLTAEDGPYDTILALNLLHVLESPKDAIAHLTGLLKPGGHLILSTSCNAEDRAWMRGIAPTLTSFGLFPQLAFFTCDELEGWLAEAGVKIEQTWKPKGKGKAVFHITRKPLY